jgi:hypothetical protein
MQFLPVLMKSLVKAHGLFSLQFTNFLTVSGGEVTGF